MGTDTRIDWTSQLVDQLDWHWQHHLRPRLDGLGDEEYAWEPVAGCWSVRPRGASTAPMAVGGGDLVLEFAVPEPVPAPVTTISWRLAHLVVGVLGARAASHFGGPPVGYETFDYPATAAGALARLDEAYARWRDGVAGLGERDLARPCGPAEGPYAEHPLAALVLHVNREVLHHGAEVLLLRDLYRHGAASRS
ncbi:DinB family protein [Saccharothrix xinjiangensis]|uniref:DinB family protein n=1 Tax=Saccharothrix xinjiangensis TaxID=204798 RepID=A0ABV9Y525_9PSEU